MAVNSRTRSLIARNFARRGEYDGGGNWYAPLPFAALAALDPGLANTLLDPWGLRGNCASFADGGPYIMVTGFHLNRHQHEEEMQWTGVEGE